jgi:hypothetical protein
MSQHKKENFTVVFHGNLGKIYDVELMLQLAGKMQEDEVDFLFIGDGEKAPLVQQCKLTNVHYYPRMPAQDVAKHVRESHYGLAFLVESDMTSKIFPVKVLEYMGSHLPFSSYPETEVDVALGLEQDYHDINRFLDETREKILRVKNEQSDHVKNDYSHYSRISQAKKLHTFIDSCAT